MKQGVFHDPLYTLKPTQPLHAPHHTHCMSTCMEEPPVGSHLHKLTAESTSTRTQDVVYYHCDLKQETLDQRMFFQQLPQSTALLFLKFNIRIRYRQPQAANTTSFFLVYGTTEREKNTFMRTSSSLTRPPVHKKVFQGQKGKVNVFKLHVKVNVRCFVV